MADKQLVERLEEAGFEDVDVSRDRNMGSRRVVTFWTDPEGDDE